MANLKEKLLQKLKNNKAFILSVLLHLLIMLHVNAVVSQNQNGNSDQSGNGQGNGSGKGKGQGNSRGPVFQAGNILPRASKQVKITLIERPVEVKKGLVIKSKKKPKKKRETGYYGIGIYLVTPISRYVDYNGHTYIGEEIREVIPDNPAADAGLLPGDLIILVNGKSPYQDGGEQITGSGPADLILTIQRNGQFLQIPVHRDWINTRKFD